MNAGNHTRRKARHAHKIALGRLIGDGLAFYTEQLGMKLLRKKDERVIQISFDFANIIARMADEKDPKTARQMMLDLKEAFPDSDRMIEFRCHAGMYAHQAGDNDTALAEMKQIAEDYKDSDDKVIKIWVDRCGRFIKTVEGGGRYR